MEIQIEESNKDRYTVVRKTVTKKTERSREKSAIFDLLKHFRISTFFILCNSPTEVFLNI
jgi:hypothetical protein